MIMLKVYVCILDNIVNYMVEYSLLLFILRDNGPKSVIGLALLIYNYY